MSMRWCEPCQVGWWYTHGPKCWCCGADADPPPPPKPAEKPPGWRWWWVGA